MRPTGAGIREQIRAVALAMRLVLRAGGWRTPVSLLLYVADGVQAVAGAWFVKLLLDATIQGRPSLALVAAGGLSLQVLAASLSRWTGYTLWTTIQEKAQHFFELELMGLIGSLPTLDLHEDPEVADTLDVLRTRSGALTGAIRSLADNVAIVARVIIGAYLLTRIHIGLLLVCLLAVPAVFLTRKAEGLRQQAIDASTEGMRRAGHLFDLATAPNHGGEIRVNGLKRTLVERHRAEMLDSARVLRRAGIIGTALRSVGWVAFIAAFLGGIAFVVRLAAGDGATAGDVLLAVILLGRLQGDLASSLESVSGVTETLAGASRFVSLIDRARSALPDNGTRPATPSRIRDGIRLESVSYRYPGAPGLAVCDVSAFLPPGSIVAIVGENGAGKSTLVKILAGLYPTTSGRVLLDDVAYESIGLDEVRRSVAGAFQDFLRPEVMLREAVGIGDVADIADEGRVGVAMHQAGASDILQAVPGGMATQLGAGWASGVELSGGQWQKVAISRGFMRLQPLLLLLDEPTAALDAETEHLLFERYASAARVAGREGNVTVLVSHRFSTVRMADLIMVLHESRLHEFGPHEQLMAAGGLYSELYEIQAGGYR